MRLGTINSDLIAKLGHEGTTLRVVYADGATFDYFGVPYTTFRALVRAKHPGREWIKLRDQYKYKEVKKGND